MAPPECQQVELGVFTVNAERMPGSCGGEFQIPSTEWNVSNHRFYIADVERGVALAIANFMTPPEYPKNNGSVVAEVFKVQDGLIQHIQAFFCGDGQLHSGWGEAPRQLISRERWPSHCIIISGSLPLAH